jgi:molybdate transport system substrate-binding protein
MRSAGEPLKSIVVMSTLAVKGALLDEIIPEFQKRTGIAVETVFDPTTVLRQRIRDGERADLIVAVSSDLDDLISNNVLSAEGAQPLVRTGIGVAIHRDVPVFPLRSVDDLKLALTNAKSVAYSRNGASGIYFAKLLERLGIAALVNARATIIDKGFTGECVERGQADLAVQQLSELAFVRGVKTVGPLPPDVQHNTNFSVAVFRSAMRNTDVAQFCGTLRSPFACESYKKFGLEIIL